jgi:quinol monooxygenase YgiN
MITIIATGRVKPEGIDALRGLVMDLVSRSRAEAGNVSYDFYQVLADPAKFAFVEVWQDQAAIDSHMASPHFQGCMANAGPLWDGPLEIGLYRKQT